MRPRILIQLKMSLITLKITNREKVPNGTFSMYGGVMNNTETLMKNLGDFEDTINYSFKNKENILLALTHSSYANENKSEKSRNNERIEFLGDAILNIVISKTIYLGYPDMAEGEMTKARAIIVCETSLAKCANKIALGKYLLLGKGEEVSGGRTRASILSDAFEAVIGAIYIDGGMDKAEAFIHKQMMNLIKDSVNGVIFMDYKTQLQELNQKNNESKIVYEIIEEKGPDHNKSFVAQVKVSDIVMGTGEGKSKKEAEQNAAKSAISKKW